MLLKGAEITSEKMDVKRWEEEKCQKRGWARQRPSGQPETRPKKNPADNQGLLAKPHMAWPGRKSPTCSKSGDHLWEAKALKFLGEGELQERSERVNHAGLRAQPQCLHQKHAAAGVDTQEGLLNWTSSKSRTYYANRNAQDMFSWEPCGLSGRKGPVVAC